MFCVKCGKEMLPEHRFCNYCGAPAVEKKSSEAREDQTADAVSQEETDAVQAAQLSQEIEDGQSEETESDEWTSMEQSDDESSSVQRTVKFGGKVGKKAGLIAAAAVLVCLGMGGIFWWMTGSASAATVPHTLKEAQAYYDEEFKKLEEADQDGRYSEYGKIADGVDNAISGVYSSEEGNAEEAYPLDVVRLTEEAETKLEQMNIEKGIQVVTALSKDKDYETMTRFYNSKMLTAENRSEMVDKMFYAFVEQKDYTKAELVLRELLDPFTPEGLKKTLKYSEYLEKNAPNRERSWVKLDEHSYDKVMPFEGGMARVALNEGTADAKDYRWGLINQDGKQVIEPRFETIGGYLEGLAAVQEDGKWGFVDEEGKLVIEPQFADLKDTQDAVFYAYAKRDPENVLRGFYNGFAAVQKNGKWGFIDHDGRELGQGIIYQDVWYFSEGYAAVELDGKYGLIDSNGNYVIKPNEPGRDGINFDVVRPIYEGLAGVNWNGRKDRGIVNREGSLVAYFDPEQIDLVQDFREGLASVRKVNGAASKWGFIDRSGSLVIPTQYDTVTVFIDGVSKVSSNNLYGLIDRSGSTLLPLEYAMIGEFVNDYAIVQKNGLFGFAGKDGTLLVPPVYEAVTNFSDGLACVKSGGKWGVIDSDGKQVLEAVYEDMKAYGNGVAPAMMNGKWGYVDVNGYFAVEPVFEKANSFSEGAAAVSDGEQYYYIRLVHVAANLDGKILDEDGSPMTNVEVSVYAQDDIRMRDAICTTVSDRNGMFKVVVPSGSYKLEAKKHGYLSSVSYEEIDSLSRNYATTIALIKESGQTEGNASVRVGNALDGDGLSSAKIKFRKGFNNETGAYVRGEDGTALTVNTGDDGIFQIRLPKGLYTAEASLEGYATIYINFQVSDVSSTQQVKTLAMTEVLPEGETRVTLEWGIAPSDLDSHLVGPMKDNYEKFHVFFPVKGQEIEDCMLDKDDTQGNGFETTTIYKQIDGIYRFAVFDYSNGSNYGSSEMSQSGARVSVYQKGACVAVFDIPANRTGNLWEVFTLDGGKITPINNVTSHQDTSFYGY